MLIDRHIAYSDKVLATFNAKHELYLRLCSERQRCYLRPSEDLITTVILVNAETFLRLVTFV